MSCYWDIKCMECGEKAGFSTDWTNHTEKEMVRIASMGDSLADAADTLLALDNGVCGWLEPTILLRRYSEGSGLPLEWFSEHGRHKLRAVDEYGALAGECHNKVKCACCEAANACKLPYGHEGPCSAQASHQRPDTARE